MTEATRSKGIEAGLTHRIRPARLLLYQKCRLAARSAPAGTCAMQCSLDELAHRAEQGVSGLPIAWTPCRT